MKAIKELAMELIKATEVNDVASAWNYPSI